MLDPFISPNEAAQSIDLSALKPTHLLLSHGHGDHIGDSMTIAHQSNCTVVAGYEVATWMGNQGHEKVIALNHGGKVNLGDVDAKFVNAVHSSSMPDGSYGGYPGGWVFYSEEHNFYYAGDTALTMDMKLIPEFGPAMDFAFLPIGDLFTMGIDDAILAAKFVQVKKVIGMHFDTFPPIKIDHEEAISKFKKAGIELVLLKPNETIQF